MKICSKCGIEKHEGEFYKNKNHKDGLKSECKACVKKYSHERYLKNRDKILESNEQWRKGRPDKRIEYGQQRLTKNRKFVDDLKKPCAKCGETRKYVIQFHHINPKEKSFNICNVNSHGQDALRIEAKKCVCLCANCHFEFHWIYGNHPKDSVSALSEYLGGDPYES